MIPLPLADSYIGEPVAVLIATCPLAVPGSIGLNVTSAGALAPGANVKGKIRPATSTRFPNGVVPVSVAGRLGSLFVTVTT